MADQIRKISEALILLVVVVSPWAFGCVHPLFWYYLTAGIAAVLALWAFELLYPLGSHIPLRRSQLIWPVGAYLLIVLLQVVPLGPIATLVSPRIAAIRSELYPNQPEIMANGESLPTPWFASAGRISIYPAHTYKRLLWLSLLALLFARVLTTATPESLRRLGFACLLNGAAISLFAIVQRFTSDTRTIYWTFQSFGNAFGPFINRNHFSFYLNICTALGIGVIGAHATRRMREEQLPFLRSLGEAGSILMIAMLSFMLGATIICSSRGGMYSFLLALVATALLLGSMKSHVQGLKMFVSGAAILGIALITQSWLGFDLSESRYVVDTNDDRTELWWQLARLVKFSPAVGTGQGTMAYLEPLSRDASTGEYFIENAHNEYLQLLIETGVPGLACGVVLLWMLWGKARWLLSNSQRNTWLYAGAALALMTIAFHSVVEFGVEIPAIAVLAVVACAHLAGLRDESPVVPNTTSLAFRLPCSLLILVVVLLAMRSAKQSDLAERARLNMLRARNDGDLAAQFEQAQRASQFASNDVELQMEVARLVFAMAETNNLARDTIVAAQRCLLTTRALCPFVADAHFILGQHVATFSQTEAPLVHLLRARTVRPTDATLAYFVAMDYLERNELVKAATQFHDSLVLSQQFLPRILEIARDRFEEATLLDQILPNELMILSRAVELLRQSSPNDTGPLQAKLLERALVAPAASVVPPGKEDYQRALIHLQMGDRSSAITAYEQALRKEPEQFAWYLQLAELQLETGDWKGALREVQRALRQQPENSTARRLQDQIIRAKP